MIDIDHLKLWIWL